MSNSVPKNTRHPTKKSTHSRSYPRGVGLDFRKLAGLTLLSYIDHHGAYSRLNVYCVYIVVCILFVLFIRRAGMTLLSSDGTVLPLFMSPFLMFLLIMVHSHIMHSSII